MPLLISQAEIDSLLLDPHQRFVGLEEICRERYEALLEEVDQNENWGAVQDARLQYMSSVVGAAKFLKIDPIDKIDLPKRSTWDDSSYEDFKNELHFYTMQLALDASVRNHQTSIELRGETRERIATLVSHLKTQVSNLEMEAARKDRLIKRIEAFEKELEERRLSFAAVGGMALVVAAAVANVDGSVDVVRRLTHEIETAVGRAFEEQEREAALLLPREEVRRLEPPRKAEPEPRAYGGGAYGKHNSDFDLDDDIPF